MSSNDLSGDKKPFSKPALTIEKLIDLCEGRGLTIDDRETAVRFIQNTGYYRFSGYMLPFQEKQYGGNSHNFTAGASMKDIISLYNFDLELRLLVMDAVGRIEVAIRALISDTMSLAHGPHWFMDAANFKESFRTKDRETSESKHDALMNDIQESMEKAGRNQTFVNHYKKTYSRPEYPPSWMLFEILHFGTVSVIYSALPPPHKKAIAAHFGLYGEVLASWLHAVSSLRNFCAHHSRLWNRVFGVRPKRPKNNSVYQAHLENNGRFYAQAAAVKILLDNTVGGESWACRLRDLFGQFPDISKKSMGFSEGWEKSDFWFPPQ